MQKNILLTNSFPLFFITVVSIMFPAQGQASYCDEKESNLIDDKGYSVYTIESLDSIDCLGRNRDQNESIEKIRVILEDKEILSLDLNSIAAINELSKIVSFINRPDVVKIQEKLDKLRSDFVEDGPLNNNIDLRPWQFNHPWIIEAKKRLLNSCSGPLTSVCQSDYKNGKNIIRVVNSVANILNYKSEPLKSEVASLYKKRVNMWQDYVEEALPQWPWEYALTGIFNPDKRESDENGQPEGPRELPAFQIRAFHLATGLAAIDTQTNSFSPTISTELLGINKLFWDNDRGRLKGGLGASLVASYTPEAEKNVSYGVMFHLQNKYSFAVIKNDGDYGVVAGIDIVSFFQKDWAKKYLQNKLPKIGRLLN